MSKRIPMFKRILKRGIWVVLVLASILWFELEVLKPMIDATSRPSVYRQYQNFPASLREAIQVNVRRADFLNQIKDREWPFRINKMPRIIFQTIEDLFHLSQTQVKELTGDELKVLAHRTFDILDRDRDGTFSSAEYDLFRQLRYLILFDVPASCRIPGEGEGAKVISISLEEGTAISSVTAHSQETVTTVATVRVESQKQPLRLVLTSRMPIIWQISGATDNMVQVILNNHASGVTGMEREKVLFAESRCLPHYFDPITREGLLARSAMIQMLGQVPDLMERETASGTVTISHDQVHFAPVTLERRDFLDREKAVPLGFDPEIWLMLLQYYDGVTYIDPVTVVSKGAVETYEVLPLEAGIAKLVHDGFIIPTPGSYTIVKDIPRLPPGFSPNWFRDDTPRFTTSPGVRVLKESL